jgi:hypothetical protein
LTRALIDPQQIVVLRGGMNAKGGPSKKKKASGDTPAGYDSMPNDGFCLLHASLACQPELNYLSVLNGKNGWDKVYENFIRPMVFDWLMVPSSGYSAEMLADRKALEAFMKTPKAKPMTLTWNTICAILKTRNYSIPELSSTPGKAIYLDPTEKHAYLLKTGVEAFKPLEVKAEEPSREVQEKSSPKDEKEGPGNTGQKFICKVSSTELKYSTRYANFGKHGAAWLNKTPITQDKVHRENYDHPFLRTVTNWHAIQTIGHALKQACLVVDHASKYGTISKWCDSPNLRMVRYLLFGFDRFYKEKNPTTDSRVIFTEEALSGRCVLNPGVHIFTDVAYYDGVLEAMLANGAHCTYFVSVIEYPLVCGTYQTYDGEGFLRVDPDEVSYAVNGNPQLYRHGHTVFRGREEFRLINPSRADIQLSVSPCFVTQIGPQMHYMTYCIRPASGFQKKVLPIREVGRPRALAEIAKFPGTEYRVIPEEVRKLLRKLIILKGDVKAQMAQRAAFHKLAGDTMKEAGYGDFIEPDTLDSFYMHVLNEERAFETKLKDVDRLISSKWAMSGLSGLLLSVILLNIERLAVVGIVGAATYTRDFEWVVYVTTLLSLFLYLRERYVFTRVKGSVSEWYNKFHSIRPKTFFNVSAIWHYVGSFKRLDVVDMEGDGAKVRTVKASEQKPTSLQNFWSSVANAMRLVRPAEEGLLAPEPLGALQDAIGRPLLAAEEVIPEVREVRPEGVNEAPVPDLGNLRGGRLSSWKKRNNRCKVPRGRTYLEPIEAEHYSEGKNSRKLLLPEGNGYLKIKKMPQLPLKCSCKSTYLSIFPNRGEVTHFGKCPLNTHAALMLRQFGATLRPSEKVLGYFKFFVENVYSRLYDDIQFPGYSTEDFIQETPSKNKKCYSEVVETIEEYVNHKRVAKVFSKTNEIHPGTQRDGNRPRCIFNPDDYLKVVGSYVGRVLFTAMKKCNSSLVAGLSFDDVADRMTEVSLGLHPLSKGKVSANWTMYSYDGSNHDAHQHPELLKIVDNWFLKKFFERCVEGSFIPPHLWKRVKGDLMNLKCTFKTDYGLKGVACGTVYSGHPTRTSLFNTVRVDCYNKFAAWMAGTEVVNFVAGDDVIGFVQDADLFKRSLLKFVGSEKTFGHFGLGQVLKDFKTGEDHIHTFLSKNVTRLAGVFQLTRMAEKLEISGCFSEKVQRVGLGQYARMQYLTMGTLPDCMGNSGTVLSQ